MLGIKHPFGGALYEQDGNGNILVTLADGSRSGTFTVEGKHLSGELRECDPQMCGWVGGPQMANHRMSKASTETD